MKKIFQILCLIVRLISGFIILMQGYEKITGGFSLEGLTKVIAQNEDSPTWYKQFFEHIIAPYTTIWEWVIPLGEIMIGLALILGFLQYYAALFGIFIMINYILADMIFTYPMQLIGFIIIALSVERLRNMSLHAVYKMFMKKEAG
ncbi:DoxX family protein [Mammaliicoccus vitulinus]|uniref:DoxX family protein n=1 Tax=Mammaliicoccus vitulinus TaxID=71237 RepID=UPI0002FBFB24|nr:DoxX family protein [Mammaliicoccus vitulinus]